MPSSSNKIQLHFSVDGTSAAGKSIDKDLVKELEKLRDMALKADARIKKLESGLGSFSKSAKHAGRSAHAASQGANGLISSLDVMATSAGALGGPMNMVSGRARSLAMGFTKFNPIMFTAVTAVAGFATVLSAATKRSMELQKNMILLDTATGDADGSFALLTAQADKMGVALNGLIQPYAKLAAATKGTSLQGKPTVDLFKAITTASAALNLSVDQTQGVFRAFEQMISKGNVQAEELRGQLGERLPGAFAMAARSMGKTTQELNQMLIAGEVLATDLIPRMTKAMQDELGAGAAKGADTLQAALNRVDNAWIVLSQGIMGSNALTLMSNSANTAAASIEGLSVFIDSLSLALGAGIDTDKTTSDLDAFKTKVENFGRDFAILADSINNSVDGIAIALELAIPALLIRAGKIPAAGAAFMLGIEDMVTRTNRLLDPKKSGKFLTAFEQQLIKAKKLREDANNPKGGGTITSKFSPKQEKQIAQQTRFFQKILDDADKAGRSARDKENIVFKQKESAFMQHMQALIDVQSLLGNNATDLAKRQAQNNIDDAVAAYNALDAAHTRAIKQFDDKDTDHAKAKLDRTQATFDNQVATLNRFYDQQDAAAEGASTTALGREDARFAKKSAALQARLDTLGVMEATAKGANHAIIEQMIADHGRRVEAIDVDHEVRRQAILDKASAKRIATIGNANAAFLAATGDQQGAEMAKLQVTLDAIDLRRNALIEQGMSEADVQRTVDELKIATAQETADRIQQIDDDKNQAALDKLTTHQDQFAAMTNDFTTAMFDNKTVDIEKLSQMAKDFHDSDLKLSEMTGKHQLATAGKVFGALSGLMDSENRKAFEIGKAAAVAKATVAGITATMETFQNTGGFPTGVIPAATMAAIAFTNVQKILATKFKGGAGSKAATSGGGAGSSNTARLGIAAPPAGLNQQGNQNQPIQIYVNGVISQDQLVNEIVPQALKKQVANNDFVLIDQRSANGQLLQANGLA